MVGNLPNFNSFDVFRCFPMIEGKISRAGLVEKLGLGEGTVKTILDILKDRKLIESTNKGHVLSNKGKNVLQNILEIINVPKKVVSKNLYPNFAKTGIVVKKYSRNKKIHVLRDIAVKEGAEGALIFDYDNKLRLREYKADFSYLNNLFDLEKNNVLIVTFAKNSRIAENSALAIAFEMNNKLKSLI